jgi:hypothetical protein
MEGNGCLLESQWKEGTAKKGSGEPEPRASMAEAGRLRVTMDQGTAPVSQTQKSSTTSAWAPTWDGGDQ